MTTLGIVGCGMLGGSFALAAKKQGCFGRAVGRDIERATAVRAKKINVIDGLWQPHEQVDAVCVAVPTQHIGSVVSELAAELSPTIPIFDVGSVKSSILADLPELPPNFVPCHPIAGSHKSGPSAARPDLFEGCVCVVSPTSASATPAVDSVSGWWEEVGARVVKMAAGEHDAGVALTSHLPHLLSYALVEMLLNACDANKNLVGSGFRDFSRLAGGDATMWRSIFVDNLDNLRLGFRELIERIERMLDDAESDPDALERALLDIARFREALNDE